MIIYTRSSEDDHAEDSRSSQGNVKRKRLPRKVFDKTFCLSMSSRGFFSAVNSIRR